MATLLVLYKAPKDPDAFKRYYLEKHVPLALKLPGLLKYDLSEGAVHSVLGASDIFFVATLHFSDVEAIKLALASPEGQAAAGDVSNFATGGADLLIFGTSSAK